MIPASRQNRLRLAKLGGAVVAVFVFAAWRVTEAVSESPNRGSRHVVSIGGDPSENLVLASTSQEPPTLPDRKDDPDTSIDPEPFRPLVVAPTASPRRKVVQPMPPALQEQPLKPKFVEAMEVVPVGATSPSLRLTGVVVGAHPTAVVMIGEEEIVVRPGSRLPDGSTLLRIAPTNVTIVREGQTSLLWVAD